MVESGHPNQVGDAAAGVTALDDYNQMNRLGDERGLGWDVGALGQPVEQEERPLSRRGMNCGDAPGMAGGPGVQEVQRLASPDLPHD